MAKRNLVWAGFVSLRMRCSVGLIVRAVNSLFCATLLPEKIPKKAKHENILSTGKNGQEGGGKKLLPAGKIIEKSDALV